jgi:hypothetical protein
LSDRAILLGRGLAASLTRIPLSIFSILVGLLAMGLSLAAGEFLHQGLYTSVDEMVSAIHARYLASGNLTGPPLGFPEAWLIPNTLMVERGWVSQYPPTHLLIMAAFFRLGLPALCGPILMGITAWFLTLSFPRLFPGEEAAGRVAGLLIALCPFFLFLAAGGLSHLTAGAAGAAVLYGGLRGRDGHPAWGIAVGAAVGIMASARPLVGLVLGAAIPITLWFPEVLRNGWRWGGRRALLTVAGGFPFALFLGWYNLNLFGHWLEFGYSAAFGSNHGLGFHTDPWGYMYGPPEALGFTSTDLLAGGVQLMETPLPLTVLLGACLLLGPGLPKGGGTLLAWGFLPVLANASYWFHDPRMLFEAAPAWILLAVLGVVQIVRRYEKRGGGWKRLAEGTAWGVVVALAASAFWGVPARWGSYRWAPETLGRIRVPAIPAGEPPLVFVHTSWDERLSSGLQGAGGMRQDSVVYLLHRTTSCQLHTYALGRAARAMANRVGQAQPPMEPMPGPEAPDELLWLPVGPDLSIRTRDGESLSPECQRQIGADRFGGVALAPLLWQGDLPGIEGGFPMFVRDQGPEVNDRIGALFPARSAYLFTPVEAGGPPVIVPYLEGMALLWGVGGTEE